MLNTTSTLKVFPPIPLTEYIGTTTAVFSSIGIVANLLVLTVLTISQRKRFSTYRYLISHLTVSYLICAIFLLVYVPIELNGHDWIYNEKACRFIYPVITFCTNLSIGTILIIAVERYRGVIFPHCKTWNKTNVCIGLIIVWVLSAVIIIPHIMVIKVTQYQNIDYCNETWNDQQVRKLYGISFFFVAFSIPLMAIGYMNVHIIIKLRNPQIKAANAQWKNKIDKRITRVLTAIVIAFFVCILPNKLLYLIWDIRPDLEKATNSNVRLYLRTVFILFYARVAVDPLLYCFFDTRFRKDLRNSVKALKGETYIDSDYSRNRSRSNISRAQISAQCDTRSRCGTTLSTETKSDFSGYLSPKNILSLENDIVTNQHIDHIQKRERSESHLNEPISSSASPLVNGSYMANFDSADFILKQLNNDNPLKDLHEREISESSSDSSSNDQNSVYGSAMPLVIEGKK